MPFYLPFVTELTIECCDRVLKALGSRRSELRRFLRNQLVELVLVRIELLGREGRAKPIGTLHNEAAV